jgi:hypothetical protein
MDLALAFHITYCDLKNPIICSTLQFKIQTFREINSLNILQIKLTQISGHSGNAACYKYTPGTSIKSIH